jgi:hypothetical protein
MGKKIVTLIATFCMLSAPVPAVAQMEQLLGGALGAAVGGSRGGGVAGAIIGVAIGTILQQLTAAEQNKRQAALQAAAKKGKSNWTTTGKDGKKATYQKVGAAEDMGGKKCSKVKETITLPDGKQGTSTETVCFG